MWLVRMPASDAGYFCCWLSNWKSRHSSSSLVHCVCVCVPLATDFNVHFTFAASMRTQKHTLNVPLSTSRISTLLALNKIIAAIVPFVFFTHTVLFVVFLYLSRCTKNTNKFWHSHKNIPAVIVSRVRVCLYITIVEGVQVCDRVHYYTTINLTRCNAGTIFALPGSLKWDNVNISI